MRIAKMPHVRFDKSKKRYLVAKRVPLDVRAIIGGGEFRYHKFLQSIGQQEANALSVGIVEGWEREWNAARPRPQVLAFPGVRLSLPGALTVEAAANITTKLNQMCPGLCVRWDNLPDVWQNAALVDEPANGSAPVYPGEQPPIQLAAPMKMAEASQVVPWEDLIEPWKKHRHSKGKATPIKAENAMRRVMNRLFAFLGHDDMARVSKGDMTRYVEQDLLAIQPNGKRLAAGGYRDHVINLQALFGLAEKTGRITTGNPTSHLAYQKKTGARGRLTEAERFAVYDAAGRETNPLFQWAPLFGLFHGVGPAEICEADTRDLIFEQGVPVLMIQIDHRQGDERVLKTTARKRGLPIHSAIRDGFVQYVQSLPPGPLFSGLKTYEGRRAKDASNKLNDWLRDTVGIAKGKSFYWLRHTVKSAYESAWLPDRLNDYLLGHSVQAVAAVYLHREIKDLIAAVELVKVPVRP